MSKSDVVVRPASDLAATATSTPFALQVGGATAVSLRVRASNANAPTDLILGVGSLIGCAQKYADKNVAVGSSPVFADFGDNIFAQALNVSDANFNAISVTGLVGLIANGAAVVRGTAVPGPSFLQLGIEPLAALSGALAARFPANTYIRTVTDDVLTMNASATGNTASTANGETGTLTGIAGRVRLIYPKWINVFAFEFLFIAMVGHATLTVADLEIIATVYR